MSDGLGAQYLSRSFSSAAQEANTPRPLYDPPSPRPTIELIGVPVNGVGQVGGSSSSTPGLAMTSAADYLAALIPFHPSSPLAFSPPPAAWGSGGLFRLGFEGMQLHRSSVVPSPFSSPPVVFCPKRDPRVSDRSANAGGPLRRRLPWPWKGRRARAPLESLATTTRSSMFRQRRNSVNGHPS